MSHHTARDESTGAIYQRGFWLVFVANLFLCTANTLTFRFAEFVKFLGGTEEQTGSIVASALFASIVWRAFLGQALDRFGTRNVWLFSTLIYLVGGVMLFFSSGMGWELYLARSIFAIGIASMFAAALSYVQSLAPPHRRTEIIAAYGASGFLGMISGAQLGDLLFQIYPDGAFLYRMLFGLSMGMGAVHGGLAALMIPRGAHVRPDVTPAAHKLLLRYWPPIILLVATMMGLVFAITTVFLTRFATSQGLGGLRLFFSVYAITAFMMRIFARSWSQQTGRHRLIVYGLVAQALAVAALYPVRESWHFIPAALCFGFGHSLLFPCVVSLAAGAFPEQYRGTGTTLTLSAIDLGTILTAPILGWVIDNYGFHPLLVGASMILVTGTVVYAVLTWHLADSDVVAAAPKKPILVAAEQRPASSRSLSGDKSVVKPASVAAATMKEATSTPKVAAFHSS